MRQSLQMSKYQYIKPLKVKGFCIMPRSIVSAHMKKSLSRLKSGQILYDNGQYDEAIGAAYYSVFHAISALLSVKNLHFSSHKGVISNFNKEYVHTGLIC